ncbi:MAG: hypothetical protein AB8F34_12280 [Akkermansiaceae bacterium]
MVEREGRGALVAVTVDAAAVGGGGIARERGVVEREGRCALVAVTVDAAAELGGIARECGVVERKVGAVVVDRPTAIAWGISRGKGEVGEGDGVTGVDLHDAGSFIGVDGDAAWNAGRIDGEVSVNEKLGTEKNDGISVE